ncbi:hypothetical protein ABZX65_26560 [Streptomyces sp. NPDC003300]|uniref:hypothetical protein n=1 Tax=unclassified Streptomyces TaxID=2593676 RepID=UPI0033A0EC32
MSEVLGVSVAQGGAVGLLALVVLMVLTGRLVPRRTYDDLLRERDTWRETAQAAEEVTRVQQRQVGELLELSRTAGHVLTSLPHPSQAQVQGVAASGIDPTAVPPG